MIYGYARVSTDGQSVTAQVVALRAAGAALVFREVASGAKTDRAQLRRGMAALNPGDVLLVTRLDRLARSTRDLLNTLAAIAAKGAAFRSLGDAWADTTTAHGPTRRQRSSYCFSSESTILECWPIYVASGASVSNAIGAGRLSLPSVSSYRRPSAIRFWASSSIKDSLVNDPLRAMK
jgi:hypothetical protein